MARRATGTLGRQSQEHSHFSLNTTALLLTVLHNQFLPTIPFSERICRFKNVKVTGYEIGMRCVAKVIMCRWINWMLSRGTMFGTNERMGRSGAGPVLRGGLGSKLRERMTRRNLMWKYIPLKIFKQKMWNEKVFLTKNISKKDYYNCAWYICVKCVCTCVFVYICTQVQEVTWFIVVILKQMLMVQIRKWNQ